MWPCENIIQKLCVQRSCVGRQWCRRVRTQRLHRIHKDGRRAAPSITSCRLLRQTPWFSQLFKWSEPTAYITFSLVPAFVGILVPNNFLIRHSSYWFFALYLGLFRIIVLHCYTARRHIDKMNMINRLDVIQAQVVWFELFTWNA